MSGTAGKVALVNTTTALSCGADCDGSISLKRKIVPTSSGFSVLMKVPPFEMFFV